MEYNCVGCQTERYTKENLDCDCAKRLSGTKIEQEDAVNHNRWRKQIRDD